MAQRFGGAHSPNSSAQSKTSSPLKGKKPRRAGGRVNALFLAALPLAIRAFFLDAGAMALAFAAFGTLVLAAWLTREGLAAQDAYDERKVARRPALPRKMFGSVLTAIAFYLATVADAPNLFSPLIFAVLGGALHSFAFGFDPMTNKGMEGIDEFQQDRVARVVDEGEKHLAAMRDAILRTEDRTLVARVETFQAIARDMFRTVEEDPRDLTKARKYLGVYLSGATDATAKFADIYARNQDTQARADYEALLDDLETNFADRTKSMLVDDKTDLDIEIEVLRDRLDREATRHV